MKLADAFFEAVGGRRLYHPNAERSPATTHGPSSMEWNPRDVATFELALLGQRHL